MQYTVNPKDSLYESHTYPKEHLYTEDSFEGPRGLL